MNDPHSQDYVLLEEAQSDGEIPLKLYQNKITGLRVVSAYVQSPIVKGDLAFATEAFDDDGLPHTLEHLVFLGSDSYPFKGFLDMMANRCFSAGTNAYTDTDHTNYTLSTAGKDGFLTMLPVYIDHLIFPTLTDEGYITEVHHINGEGEDAGVVYCEMQASENTGDSRCYLEMLRSLYPGVCGYKSETGGILENLRTSTSNEKVRKYHKEFYHPKNMCVVVTGPVEPEEIFKAIKPIEDKIVSRGLHQIDFKRPWQSKVEPLPESARKIIEYSSDTYDDGIVCIGYRGPKVIESFREFVAITILLDYLNSTAISPVQLEFVESDEPICSCVSHSMIENSVSCIYFTFESVNKEFLDYKILDKLNEVLASVVEQKKKFDMDRLRTIISRKIVRILATAETSPHAVIAGPVIGHFLYGNDSIKGRCQEIPQLEALSKLDETFWIELIKTYMLGENARYSLVIGKPSPEKMKEQSNQEKERLNNQRKSLEAKLGNLRDQLDAAKLKNEEAPPQNIFDSFPKATTDNIVYHQIERVVLDWDQPIRLQYDSIKTDFFSQTVLFDTSNCLNQEDRLYLPLLSEMLFESQVRDVPYESVIERLFSDTVSYATSVGIGSGSAFSAGFFSMLFVVHLQVELRKQQKAITWLADVMYHTVFTPERIKIIATRMVNEISQFKRSGSKMASSVMKTILYKKNSNHWTSDFMRQYTFLRRLLQELKEDPEKVQTKLTKIRDCLAKPGNMLIHLTFDKNKVDSNKIIASYREFTEMNCKNSNEHQCQINLENLTPCHELVELNPVKKQAIISLGSVETKYLHQIVPAIKDHNHEDVAPLHVFLQYLNQLEGPIWREVRGLGLSYHIDLNLSVDEGLLRFLLAKATQVAEAYEKCHSIVSRFLDDDAKFDDDMLLAAKSSLIFCFIKREKSPADRSLQSLVCYLRNLPIEHNKNLISRIEKVTTDDMRRVGAKYLKPLFESKNKLTVLCCHTDEAEPLKKKFKELGCGDLELLSVQKSEFLSEI